MKKSALTICLFFYILFSQAQSLDNLLNKVGSSDKEEAFLAYEKILNSDPDELRTFFSKRENKEKLEGNKNLENSNPFWDIIPIASMTDYCRKQNIAYRSDSLKNSLMNLYSSNIDDYDRFFTENKIIPNLRLSDIPALEYYAFLYGNYGSAFDWPDGNYYCEAFDVSICRMLDILYEKHWKEITNSDFLLRFYIYKCMVFSEPGYSSSFNRYYMRFRNQSIGIRDKLHQSYLAEKREDVKDAFLIAIYMLEKDLPENQRLNIRIPLKDYLKKMDKAIRYSDYLITISDDDLKLLFEKIKRSNEVGELQELFALVDEYGTYKSTPYLIDLFKDKRVYSRRRMSVRFTSGNCSSFEIIKKIDEKALESLEKIYGYSFKNDTKYSNSGVIIINEQFGSLSGKNAKREKQFWKELWKTNGEEAHLWKFRFLESRLKYLQEKDTLYGDEIVQTLNNCELTGEQRAFVIKQTVKLRNASAIEDIRFREGENLPKEILETFANLEIFYGDYNEVLDNVDMQDEKYFLDHFLLKLEQFDKNKQAYIMKDILCNESFKSIFKHSSDTAFINLVRNKFKFETKDYERKNGTYTDRILFFLETLNFNINQKIDYIISQRLSNNNYVAEAFYPDLNWNEWAVVIKRWKEIDVKTEWVKETILRKYMGMSMGKMDSLSIGKLERDMGKTDEVNLKCQYLKDTEMPVLTDKGTLDFNLIYKYLHYNYVSDGFATGGNGGSYEITWPVVGLLKKHFNSGEGSVNYWIRYLENNNLVNYRFKTAFLGNIVEGHIDDTIFNYKF
jgi:hypothetical protein